MKNKLTELLNDSFAKQYEKRGLLTAHHTAEDLIANGVTIISSCEGCLFSNRKRPQKCSCCRRNKDMADLFTPKSNVRHWSDYPPKEEA